MHKKDLVEGKDVVGIRGKYKWHKGRVVTTVPINGKVKVEFDEGVLAEVRYRDIDTILRSRGLTFDTR